MPQSIHTQLQNNLEKIIDLYFKNTGRIETINNITITELGIGENNINLKIKLNQKSQFVVRIVQNENNSYRLEHEFETLQKLPPGLGPQPIALDLTKTVLSNSFLLESVVEGEKIEQWNPQTLKLLAQTMAKYHSIKSSIYGNENNDLRTFNIANFFYSVNREYLETYPDLRKDPELQKLLPKLNIFLRSSQFLFDQLTHFSLIHGDLTQQNILINEQDIHILDWEVSSFGDNANDFVTFFYDDFAYHNWRVWLDPHHQKVFIDEYLDHFDDPTLKERLKVWMVFDKSCSLIYCKQKLESYKQRKANKTLTEDQLKIEIAKLIKSLEDFFKDYNQ